MSLINVGDFLCTLSEEGLKFKIRGKHSHFIPKEYGKCGTVIYYKFSEVLGGNFTSEIFRNTRERVMRRKLEMFLRHMSRIHGMKMRIYLKVFKDKV